MNKRLILTNVAMTTLLVFAGTSVASIATAEAREGPRKSRMAKFDKNGNGKLDPGEKQALLRQRVGKIMTRLDVVRKDGQIGPREAQQAGPRMARLLSSADINGDKIVTRAELRAALQKFHKPGKGKQWKNKNGKRGKQWQNKNGKQGKQWKNNSGKQGKQWNNKKGKQGTRAKAAAWRQANLPRFATAPAKKKVVAKKKQERVIAVRGKRL